MKGYIKYIKNTIHFLSNQKEKWSFVDEKNGRKYYISNKGRSKAVYDINKKHTLKDGTIYYQKWSNELKKLQGFKCANIEEFNKIKEVTKYNSWHVLDGYHITSIWRKIYRTHKLVAEHFLWESDMKYVVHKNYDWLDNRSVNLEYSDSVKKYKRKNHWPVYVIKDWKKKHYLNIQYAIRELWLDKSTCYKVLKGIRKHYKGYTFKHA